ncbi:hypothetical protein WJX81_002208 [Elliptochloris bilobata]|uniref:Uncharacterized protein n=1 Tax=Elliptochloris bilobata TaxID=381761 RepID=A0AAW1REJ4_9CHLO
MIASTVLWYAQLPVLCAAYNAARGELYSSGQDPVIRVWGAVGGALLRRQPGHRGWVLDLLFETSVRLLFSAATDRTVGVWSDRGQQLQVVQCDGSVHALAWCPVQPLLVVGLKAQVAMYAVDTAEAARIVAWRKAGEGSGGEEGKGAAKLGATQPPAQLLTAAVLRLHAQPLPAGAEGHGDVVRALACTPQGIVFTAGYDRTVCILTPDGSHGVRRLPNAAAAGLCSACLDAHSNSILAGCLDGSMQLWSIEGRCLDSFDGVADQAVSAACVPMTRSYWATSATGHVTVIDPRGPTHITDYVRSTSALDAHQIVALRQPAGTDVLLGWTCARELVLWRYNPAAAHRVFATGVEGVECMVVAEDGGGSFQVFTGNSRGAITNWQLDSEQNVEVYRPAGEQRVHRGMVTALAFAPELGALISAGEDGTVRLQWTSSREEGARGVLESRLSVLEDEIQQEQEMPRKLAEAAVRMRRASARLDVLPAAARRFANPDPLTNFLPDVVLEHSARVAAIVVLNDCRLATASSDRQLRIWCLRTFKLLSSVPDAHDTPLQGVAYAAEREELITCAVEKLAKVWDAAGLAAPRLALAGHTGLVSQVAWVPWARFWLTAGDDGTLRCWSPADGRQLRDIACPGGSVQAVLADDANRVVLVATNDRRVRAWDLASSQPLATYAGHADCVRALGVLPDQGLYMTGGWDRTLRLWFEPPGRQARGQLRRGPWAHWGALPSSAASQGRREEAERGVPELAQPRALRRPRVVSGI